MSRELSKREQAWLKRVQKALDACPNKRLGFYTIGDCYVTVYDKMKEREINEIADRETGEFCNAVEDADAFLETLTFPSHVHSTVG